MKNKKVLGIIILVFILLTIMLITIIRNNDSNKFSKEYNTKIPSSTSIIYLNDENLIQKLETEDKLVFIGKNSSEEAKKAVKKLLEVAKETNIDKIYYYDVKNIEKKPKLSEALKKKISKNSIICPTFFLVKDKKIVEIEEGYTDNLESKYEEIMIEYTMCSKPNC